MTRPERLFTKNIDLRKVVRPCMGTDARPVPFIVKKITITHITYLCLAYLIKSLSNFSFRIYKNVKIGKKRN